MISELWSARRRQRNQQFEDDAAEEDPTVLVWLCELGVGPHSGVDLPFHLRVLGAANTSCPDALPHAPVP